MTQYAIDENPLIDFPRQPSESTPTICQLPARWFIVCDSVFPGRCPMLSCVTLSESGDEDLERLIDNGYRMDMRMPGIWGALCDDNFIIQKSLKGSNISARGNALGIGFVVKKPSGGELANGGSRFRWLVQEINQSPGVFEPRSADPIYCMCNSNESCLNPTRTESSAETRLDLLVFHSKTVNHKAHPFARFLQTDHTS